jgi:hypothetical protein
MLDSLTYCIYEGRKSLCIIVIVLEKSWREQEAMVCDINPRRMHEEERDALERDALEEESDDLSCRANCSDDIVALFLLMQDHEEPT